jgi:hypothetical protein
MTTETKITEPFSSTASAVPTKSVGDDIKHEDFIAMLDVLESLEQHRHNYTDTYFANCQCQCSSSTM